MNIIPTPSPEIVYDWRRASSIQYGAAKATEPSSSPALPNSPTQHSSTPTLFDRPPPPNWRPSSLLLALENLPPLPTIHSRALVDQFQLHKSEMNDHLVREVFGREQGSYRLELLSNKRLETLGDAVLKGAWLAVLSDAFPGLTSSGLHHLCKPLLENNTLSRISWRYGGFGDTARASMHGPKSAFLDQTASADIFEAFLGALCRDGRDGINRVHDFIKALFEAGVFPTLGDTVNWMNARSTAGLPLEGAKPTRESRKHGREGGASEMDGERVSKAGRVG